jgi:hypothetical protein
MKARTYDITANTLLVNSERLHRKLHSVEAGGFPDKVDGKVVGTFSRYTVRPAQFQSNFVRDV